MPPSNLAAFEYCHAGSYVTLDPSGGMLTRGSIILMAGSGLLTPGLVLGSTLAGGAVSATPMGANVGNGTFGPITSTGESAGAYVLHIVAAAPNAGAFVLEDPAGVEVGHGTVGIPFSAGGLSFTLADGSADFAAGDSFALAVTGGVLKHAPFDPLATNGLEKAVAITWDNCQATATDRRAVATIGGPITVKADRLYWGANVTTSAQKVGALANLRRLGIQAV